MPIISSTFLPTVLILFTSRIACGCKVIILLIILYDEFPGSLFGRINELKIQIKPFEVAFMMYPVLRVWNLLCVTLNISI